VFGVILTNRTLATLPGHLAASGDSFTYALHTCALVGGISILIAAVISFAVIGIRRTVAAEPAEA